ncbi:hypothetical protein [uncultured Pseudoalteromonas sp.]
MAAMQKVKKKGSVAKVNAVVMQKIKKKANAVKASVVANNMLT